MVAPRLRSRSKKRKYRRTPGGETVIHYDAKKHSRHHCARCGGVLDGTPSGTPIEIKRMKRSERVPERPYAGVLCSGCTEKLMRYKTRFEIKFNHLEFKDMELQRDLTLEKFLPRGWWKEISTEVEEK